MIDICMALNDLLHQHRWEDADKLLRDAVVSEPAPVLIALAMFSTGAARHLPSRNMLFEHVLLHEEMSPQTRAAIQRMAAQPPKLTEAPLGDCRQQDAANEAWDMACYCGDE